MGRTRRSRRAFSLTEILMAVGILGIGLTMVASVFPVAVDQSRRSREITMAALAARSVAASMRARRDIIAPYLRAIPSGTGAIYKTTEVSINSGLPARYRVYNPDLFLYDNPTPRTYPDTTDMYTMWQEGNYVPVVLATPTQSQLYDGPWRLTILIYKSRGAVPDCINFSSTGGKYMGSWGANRGAPGGYVVDWRPADANNIRGEAFLVDRVVTSTTGVAATDTIYLAAPVTTTVAAATVFAATQSPGITGSTGLPGWVSLPGAIAVYHTIIGD